MIALRTRCFSGFIILLMFFGSWHETLPMAMGKSHRYFKAAETKNDQLWVMDVTVVGSLTRTIQQVLPSKPAAQLTAHAARIIMWWLNLKMDMERGDRAHLLYRLPQADKQAYENMQIVALEYTSGRKQQIFAAYLYQQANAEFPRYYNKAGRQLEPSLTNMPIENYEQITSLMDRTGRKHHGVDYKAPKGTAVLMPYAGVITRKNWNMRYNGKCLAARFDSGKQALFLHLDAVHEKIVPGKYVQAGHVIAKVGNTGRSTADHLHYQLMNARGKDIDPYANPANSVFERVATSEYPRFFKNVENYKNLMHFGDKRHHQAMNR